TLLNYCGIRGDLVEFVADLSPHKQGRLLPGSRIPVVPPERIAERKPDYVLILPWNLREEIAEQLGFIRAWGGRFVTVIPELRVF
ncbi:MAG: methyltransferase C-terminal domain-containing protein, partial [Planctomycetota bacterium]